jgi:hypothetical protein
LQEYQGDDALQPDQDLRDDKHPWLRNKNQQPFASQDANADLPLHSEFS